MNCLILLRRTVQMALSSVSRSGLVAWLLLVALSSPSLVFAEHHGHHDKGAKPDQLKGPGAFKSIQDKPTRSVAIFEELGKVLQHPRCVNCHGANDRPLQGDNMQVHMPPVERGKGGMGKPGMMCITCHGNENQAVQADWDMPGHAPWHMAPASQVWEGKTLGEICRQIKDKERNGGKTLDEIVHHMAKDGLVGWGWHPGKGRTPAPGSQKIAGELTQAWVESGAHCP